jgi:hypothetical protein
LLVMMITQFLNDTVWPCKKHATAADNRQASCQLQYVAEFAGHGDINGVCMFTKIAGL